ncbi:hypothetical protein HGRIS_000666 [Hohenbuehelia grisea]|uniref:F-box domain-containing protein n=1 Tax=Hohenbuehelia grisea TaxID=104357 RepID=A0ABR3JTL9_9AGAR
MTRLALPDDIWLEVAKYIPAKVLRGFYRINALFFNISMNLRYAEVHLSALTTRLDRLVEHLKLVVFAYHFASEKIISHGECDRLHYVLISCRLWLVKKKLIVASSRRAV